MSSQHTCCPASLFSVFLPLLDQRDLYLALESSDGLSVLAIYILSMGATCWDQRESPERELTALSWLEVPLVFKAFVF